MVEQVLQKTKWTKKRHVGCVKTKTKSWFTWQNEKWCTYDQTECIHFMLHFMNNEDDKSLITLFKWEADELSKVT